MKKAVKSIKEKKTARQTPPSSVKPVEGINRFKWWYGLLILLPLTYISFSSCLRNDFTNWDDPGLIIDNPHIKEISSENIKRIFSDHYFANYQPLHMLSYMIEYHFFRLDPGGYHAVSVVMHVINAGLVLWLVYLLSGNFLVAFLSALFFAVNPMRVESVAWASERKDLLYSLFFFASLLAYVKYVKVKLSLKYYLLSFLFFILSVFSKAMAVSLVPVLFMADYFFHRKYNARAVLEKIPFIVLAVIMGIVSVRGSAEADSFDTFEVYSFTERLILGCSNLLLYVYKSLVPLNLTAFYNYPEKINGSLPFGYLLAPVIIFGLLALIVWSMRKTRLIFFCAAFFVSTVVLVLMILPVGPTLFSERYSYIPSVALFFLLATGIQKIIEKKNQPLNFVLYLLIAAYSVALSIGTFNRCKMWKDTPTLWTDVIEKNPRIPQAYNNRGNYYEKQNEYEKAIADFNEALKLNNTYALSYFNRGSTYGKKGMYKEALEDLNTSLKYDSLHAEAYKNRGQAYAMLGNLDLAYKDFYKALEIQPDYGEVYFNLGITKLSTGFKTEGCDFLRKAVSMKFEPAIEMLEKSCKN